jgi:hypothetical protein
VEGCAAGVTTDDATVSVVGGTSQGWVSIGGDVAIAEHTVASGNLGIIVGDEVTVDRVHVVDGFARLMASAGASVTRVRIAGDDGLILVNLGSAPFVADQITTTAYTSRGLRLEGFGPFDVSDVLGGYATGPLLESSAFGASVRYAFAAGGAPLGTVPCTNCAVVGDVLTAPPGDVRLVDSAGIVGSGEGCTGEPPGCEEPGVFGGPGQ